MSDSAEHIVVVEDSAPNLKILAHYIRMYGFEVIECIDGQVALDEMKNVGDRKVVAIFSDLMMPNMDGLEFLQELRKLDQIDHQNIPFVFISAVLDGDKVMTAMENGINDYILKPASKEKVEEKLKEIFPDREIKAKTFEAQKN